MVLLGSNQPDLRSDCNLRHPISEPYFQRLLEDIRLHDVNCDHEHCDHEHRDVNNIHDNCWRVCEGNDWLEMQSRLYVQQSPVLARGLVRSMRKSGIGYLMYYFSYYDGGPQKNCAITHSCGNAIADANYIIYQKLTTTSTTTLLYDVVFTGNKGCNQLCKGSIGLCQQQNSLQDCFSKAYEQQWTYVTITTTPKDPTFIGCKGYSESTCNVSSLVVDTYLGPGDQNTIYKIKIPWANMTTTHGGFKDEGGGIRTTSYKANYVDVATSAPTTSSSAS